MIAVEIQDEDGRTESSFGDPLIIYQLQKASPPDTACLRFIDPVGDTTFNQYQVAVLIEEMESVIPRLVGEEAQRRARALVEFARIAATSEPHTYLKFIGD